MRITEPYTIFKRTLKSGRIVYYYQFRDNENQRSTAKSTGCSTLASARRFCQKLYNSDSFKSVKSCILFKNYTADFFGADSDFVKWKKVNNQEVTAKKKVKHL